MKGIKEREGEGRGVLIMGRTGKGLFGKEGAVWEGRGCLGRKGLFGKEGLFVDDEIRNATAEIRHYVIRNLITKSVIFSPKKIRTNVLKFSAPKQVEQMF